MGYLDLSISQRHNTLALEPPVPVIVWLFHIKHASPFQVCILDVEEELGAKTATEFQSQYGKENALFIHCDVTIKENLEGMCPTRLFTYGPTVCIKKLPLGVWDLTVKRKR